MFSKSMQDAINVHINRELFSSYLYLSMAAYCDSISLPGFANWMKMQAYEENMHAMKMFDYITDRGGRVELKAIDQPPVEFNSALDVFEKTLEHEQKVTGFINELYAKAVDEKDYASQAFLQWFITEQVEEEKTATEIVDQLRKVGENATALLMMDRYLGQRQAG